MNWSMFFKRGNPSAPVACERLQILLAHERSEIGHSNLISTLREEILAAISRHVAVEPDKVQVKMDRGPVISTLEIEVEIPNVAQVSRLAANA
ncbi:MAG: cell division topological specificity factor MinE [Rhodoplanes sp.]|jgi:cell division topological specificity factor